MLPIVFAGCCFISTYLGGLFALHYEDLHHKIISFCGGVVLMMALGDLLPDAIYISHNPNLCLLLCCVGFIVYLILNSITSIVSHTEECQNKNHKSILGGASLSLHSYFDGATIILVSKISPILLIPMFISIASHDISDGIITTKLIINNQGNRAEALKWLFIDAIAPIIGAISFYFVNIPPQIEGYILAILSGFFLFISTNQLLPEAHHDHPKFWNIALTILGATFIYFVVKIAG